MISIIFMYLLSCITQSQPTNDDPCDAIPIVLTSSSQSETIQGADTSSATLSVLESGLPFCGTGSTTAGIWYKVSGVTDLSVEVENNMYDTKLTLWVAQDCNDLNTFTCVAGNDDCAAPIIPMFGSCVAGEAGECFDEIYIHLHGFGGSVGETDLIIEGTPNTLSCGDCGHTWNTGPNKVLQCATDDDCCPDLSCNAVNGKCNLSSGTDSGEIICGHIQNSGPNQPLDCTDSETNCCDGFRCNSSNGKCIKKKMPKSP